MTLNSQTAPSGNFDLTNWKITLPVDSTGGIGGSAYEVKNLAGYQNGSSYFTASDGAMVFRAAVDGATTSGSKYARSELREMNSTSNAAWSIATGGFMKATLEIDEVPTLFSGAHGKVVVGQIHGKSDELARLYWDNGTMYFVNDIAGATGKETKFYFKDVDGKPPSVSLNEKFSYSINATAEKIVVTLYVDGKVYTASDAINSAWLTDTLYFKAGTYLGTNETQGTGYGQTSFYALSFNHTGDTTPPDFGGYVPPVQQLDVPQPPAVQLQPKSEPEPKAEPQPKPEAGKVLKGTNAKNTIKGTDGNDTIDALRGNDTVNGKSGNDKLTGGTGSDIFVFDTVLASASENRSFNFDKIVDYNVKSDRIHLDNAIFTKLVSGTGSKPAQLKKEFFVVGSRAQDKNDYIVYNKKTGVLSYDCDGSGSKLAVEFAQVTKGLALTHKDFFVI
ncbi:polysaccharide lyase family 7 protein [Microvirga sp. BT688]|uniref:polysaccharide lyase family 7 protein n=1 Tax=Microvirga sp. TaxID=1873136 RepID=UPI0016828972|nr:polysaccharide lyase family 7 protein [Microvirga sp.]MBD2745756.1 polysaccharide lyase family 7 protein [Microvirga sp.]